MPKRGKLSKLTRRSTLRLISSITKSDRPGSFPERPWQQPLPWREVAIQAGRTDRQLHSCERHSHEDAGAARRACRRIEGTIGMECFRIDESGYGPGNRGRLALSACDAFHADKPPTAAPARRRAYPRAQASVCHRQPPRRQLGRRAARYRRRACRRAQSLRNIKPSLLCRADAWAVGSNSR